MFTAAILLALSSCGYTFEGSGSILPSDIKTLAIRTAENNTTVPSLGVRFTEKLRSRFERYGAVKVVNPGQPADAELVSRVLSVSTSVADTTGQTDISLEQYIYFTASAELRRRNGQVLYRNPSIRTHENIANTSDVVNTSSSSFASGTISASTLSGLGSREVTRAQQEQALDDLMEEAARKLYLEAVAAEF